MARRARERGTPGSAGGWPLALMALVLALIVLALPTPARADNVDILLGDLKTGRDYKVRLSAALGLVRLGDIRALPGFIAALDDKDKTVRGAAVAGLSKLVDSNTSDTTRKRVLAALDQVAAGDPGDSVTKQAIATRAKIAKLGAPSGPQKGGMYMDLAPFSAKPKGAEGLRDLMRATVKKGLIKLDPKILLAWPSGKDPTQKELDKAVVRGYHLDGNILDVTVAEKGAASLVSCKISMLLATFPGKSIFGFLEGGARVQASNTAKDIELAKQDCVTAVVEDLVAKKIMPTIRTKAGPNQ